MSAQEPVTIRTITGGAELLGLPPVLLMTAERLLELPCLVMQVVVLRGEKTDEGHVIKAVLQPWFDIVEALLRNPNDIFNLPWDKVEEMVAGAYRRLGADVILTPRSGDHGRDVIATLPVIGAVRVIESVKAYGRGHMVGYDDVRALLGVVEADNASKGFLTTTSDFPPKLLDDPLLKPYFGRRLECINGTQLLKRLGEIASKPPIK